MDTPLTGTASKWISNKPRWTGDLISNLGLYWPQPDYDDEFYKMLAVNAEKYTQDASRARWAYRSTWMKYAAASSGWDMYAIASLYPKRIMEGSERFMIGPDDVRFLTTQRATKTLAEEISQSDVFARNTLRDMQAVEFAANQPRYRSSYIIGPADQEGAHRSLFKKHAIIRGTEYEDAIWEMHLWGPLILHDIDGGIYHGDHAWSRNAVPEKAMALGVQYGMTLPLMIRRGNGYDVADIFGRDVSIVDQAWEDARHVIDVVERGFRTDPAVALIATRFMYDHLYRTRSGPMEFGRAHEVVQSHAADSPQQEKLNYLKSLIGPYMARFCNTPQLRAILDEDPALRDYWDEHIMPMGEELPLIPVIEKEILSYLPRGGFNHPHLRCKVERAADAPSSQAFFSMHGRGHRPVGIHEAGFDCHWDPQLYNDADFPRLGSSSDPDTKPDSNHLTFEQGACIRMLDAFRGGGRRPVAAPKTLVYLDEPGDSLRAAAYQFEQGVQNPNELSAIFDPLVRGSDTFQEFVQGEAQDDFLDRVREITVPMHGREAYEDWRDEYGIGNIIPYSDFKAAAKGYESRREGLDAEYHQGIAGDGPMKISGNGVKAVAKRFVGLEADGMILPAGYLTKDSSFELIMSGLQAALGKSPRPYSGGKYQFEFFMDHHYHRPPYERLAPRKMDFADLFLHVCLPVKAALMQKNPQVSGAMIATALRMCDVYEKLIDPARCNIKKTKDPLTNADHVDDIIDWNQVDPNFIAFAEHEMNPGLPEFYREDSEDGVSQALYDEFFGSEEYRAFERDDLDLTPYLADPVRKAHLVKMLWGWMKAVTVPGVDAPIRGNLLVRGIHACDRFSLRGLDNTNEEPLGAWRWWQNKSELEQATFLRSMQLHVYAPGLAVR